MTNNVENFSTSWTFNERLGPRINPNDWFEINPYVSYNVTKSTNTLPDAPDNNVKTTALSVDGKVYLFETWLVGYSASKNYVTGISSNLTKNPFVVNAYFEKELFKKRNGILSVQLFDLLDQNNFVTRVTTPTGYTDTKSNALSRYIMVSFRINLQKWSGAPKHHGQLMQRRGDGSFINN
ncbi:porin family protein [Mucilaginibacter sp.]